MTEIVFTGLFLFALGRCFEWCIKTKNPFLLLLGAMFFVLPTLTAYEQGAILPVICGIVGVLSSFGISLTGWIPSLLSSLKFRPRAKQENSNSSRNSDSGRNYYEEARSEQDRQKRQHQSEKRSWQEEQRKQQNQNDQQKREWQREQERQQQQKKSTGEKKRPETKKDTRTAMQILGLNQGYSKKDLKDAYRRQSARFHPDKNVGKPPHLREAMEEEMKKVNEAYNKLS